VPADDDPVPEDVLLHRLIPPLWWKPIDGVWEPSSGGFDNSSGAGQDMSVVLGDTLAAMGRTAESLVEGRPDWGVASLPARAALAEGQTIRRTPTPEEPAHGDVIGPKSGKRRGRLKKAVVSLITPATPVPAPIVETE
jgi:hypothetical protein